MKRHQGYKQCLQTDARPLAVILRQTAFDVELLYLVNFPTISAD
jgi:hypothetical protein